MRLKDKEKRAAICRETYQLVAEQGVSALKMADLAKRVGVSVSTLYVYFKDKDDLVLSLFREVTRQMVEEAVQEFRIDQPYVVNLKNIWIRYLNFRISHHLEVAFYENVKKSVFFEIAAHEVKEDEMRGPMGLIRLGKANGHLKDLDEKLLLATLSGMTDRYSDMFHRGEIPLTPENIELCFNLMWDSIRA